jgi:hypothetical protein
MSFMVKVGPLTPEVGHNIGIILAVPLYANSATDRGVTWWVFNLPGVV